MNTTTEPQTNQEIVTNLAEWLRAHKEKPCPNEFCDAQEPQGEGRCPECNGTGTITDPKLQAAWEMLAIRHPDCLVLKQSTCDSLLQRYWGDCHGSGFAPVPITTWPWSSYTAMEAAVRGLLEQVMETICGIERFRWCSSIQELYETIMEELEARYATS